MKPHDNYDFVLFTVDPMKKQNDSGQRGKVNSVPAQLRAEREANLVPVHPHCTLGYAHYYKFDF